MPRNLIGPSKLSLFISLADILPPVLLIISLLLNFNRYHCSNYNSIGLSLTVVSHVVWSVVNTFRRRTTLLRVQAAAATGLKGYLDKLEENLDKLEKAMANLPILPANMDIDLPIVISDGEEVVGTAREPIVLDSSDEAEDGAEHVSTEQRDDRREWQMLIMILGKCYSRGTSLE
jgi:hypothetical protein